MNTIDNNVKIIAKPEEAVANLIGEHFLEWLLESISQEVKGWPELIAVRDSQTKSERVRKFMIQRYLAAEAFLGGREGDPGLLGFAISNLSESPDPLAENALGILEQKRDENLSERTKTHHELWIKLLKSLEVTSDEISKAEAKEATRNYISNLSDLYSNSEWQTAMGAFLAHERAIPDEYAALKELLKKNTSVSPEDMEVLTWHAGVDLKYVVNTSHMLEKILVDPESKQLVWDGVSRQLSERKELYSNLLKYLAT